MENYKLKSNIIETKSEFNVNLSINKEKIDINSFNIIKLIGKGSFGRVYLIELKSNKKKYAMKVIEKNLILKQNIMKYIITEKNVLSKIKHPFIVQLYYSFQNDENLYLIMEYCSQLK